MSSVSREISRTKVLFNDDSLVANAGLILPATLMVQLSLESVVNDLVRLVGRVGGALPGRKIATVVAANLAGGTHTDHADILRAGSTSRVLPFRVMAPSTLGTFLRAFTFGHVRQLDKVIGEMIRRAWALGAGPGSAGMVIDLDSTICEVHGHSKHGAAYGCTHCLGYHPLVATRADTGEILHARMRKGSSQRGHKQFVSELIARVRRCGATGPLSFRADSGFWSWKLIDTLTNLGIEWSITVSSNPAITKAINQIDDDAWQNITYPDGGTAQVADTVYVTGKGKQQRSVRLVVRLTRLIGPAAQLWPEWRHHAFVTNNTLAVIKADQFHRDHARVEHAIKDLKEGSGLEHCPSGKFPANGAWLACGVLAHNLTRWTTNLGGITAENHLTVTRTIRTRHYSIPGRLVNRSGHRVLRLPTDWPWSDQFTRALTQLRNLPIVA